jgi:hypothetical protein
VYTAMVQALFIPPAGILFTFNFVECMCKVQARDAVQLASIGHLCSQLRMSCACPKLTASQCRQSKGNIYTRLSWKAMHLTVIETGVIVGFVCCEYYDRHESSK